jgi:hypothetical protein
MIPSRRELQDVRRAIRKDWGMKAEEWERSADGALEAILDPTTGHLVKLQAMLLFIDAAEFGPFDVEATLKRILGRDRDRQIDTQETDPPDDGCS